MIVCTFINGVLDVNIVNTAFVCIGVTVITCIAYFTGLIVVNIITGR